MIVNYSQSGDVYWSLLRLEHGIDASGLKNSLTDSVEEPFRTFFNERREKIFAPNALFVDLGPERGIY